MYRFYPRLEAIEDRFTPAASDVVAASAGASFANVPAQVAPVQPVIFFAPVSGPIVVNTGPTVVLVTGLIAPDITGPVASLQDQPQSTAATQVPVGTGTPDSTGPITTTVNINQPVLASTDVSLSSPLTSSLPNAATTTTSSTTGTT